ncbi:MAG: DUF1848 family protein, partial [Pseudomonadota bacterium]
MDHLQNDAVGVSASRRTDIPALYARWFERRLEAGEVAYQARPNARPAYRSIRPEHVTHFAFWTRWPPPFLRTLDHVLRIGYPTLWNVTITGLGGTAVEPHVPTTDRAVAALKTLSGVVGRTAVMWRYDPIFLTRKYGVEHHVRTFNELAGKLAEYVDRVAVSFVVPYGQRVKPDLDRYQVETGDHLLQVGRGEKADLLGTLRSIANAAGVTLCLCCVPELEGDTGLLRAGCNSWEWVARAHPVLLD